MPLVLGSSTTDCCSIRECNPDIRTSPDIKTYQRHYWETVTMSVKMSCLHGSDSVLESYSSNLRGQELSIICKFSARCRNSWILLYLNVKKNTTAIILDLKFRAAVHTEQEISYRVRTVNSQIIVDEESEPQPVASHSLWCNSKTLDRKHVSQTTNCYIRSLQDIYRTCYFS
jgi:hypothetical protein